MSVKPVSQQVVEAFDGIGRKSDGITLCQIVSNLLSCKRHEIGAKKDQKAVWIQVTEYTGDVCADIKKGLAPAVWNKLIEIFHIHFASSQATKSQTVKFVIRDEASVAIVAAFAGIGKKGEGQLICDNLHTLITGKKCSLGTIGTSTVFVQVMGYAGNIWTDFYCGTDRSIITYLSSIFQIEVSTETSSQKLMFTVKQFPLLELMDKAFAEIGRAKDAVLIRDWMLKMQSCFTCFVTAQKATSSVSITVEGYPYNLLLNLSSAVPMGPLKALYNVTISGHQNGTNSQTIVFTVKS